MAGVERIGTVEEVEELVALQRATRPHACELDLIGEIVKDALALVAGKKASESWCTYTEAVRWVYDRRSYPWSFVWCCEWLHLHPSYLRLLIRRDEGGAKARPRRRRT